MGGEEQKTAEIVPKPSQEVKPRRPFLKASQDKKMFDGLHELKSKTLMSLTKFHTSASEKAADWHYYDMEISRAFDDLYESINELKQMVREA